MKNLVKLLLSLAIVFLTVDFALSQWTITRLTDNAINDNAATIAVDELGTVHMVYPTLVGNGRNGSYKLFYVKKEIGGTFSAPVRVTNTPNGQDEYYPEIIIDNLGLHVAFQLEEYTNAYALFYVLYTGSPATSIELFEGRTRYPSMAIDNNGFIHITFSHYDGITGSEIYYMHNYPSGVFMPLPFNVTATLEPVSGNIYPSIAVSNTGNAYIAYVDSGDVGVPGVESGDADVSYIYNQTAYANDFTTPVRANPYEPGNIQYYFPSLVIDGSYAHIAYRRLERITTRRSDCYYVRLERDTPQTPSITEIKQVSILTDANLGNGSAGIQLSPDGSLVHLAWIGGLYSEGLTSREAYHATVTVDAQQTVSAAEQITNNNVWNVYISMDIGSSGNIHISYLENDPGKRSSDLEVWYATNSALPTTGTLSIASIGVVAEGKGKNVNGKVTVVIVDENSAPVDGATVTGDWSGLTMEQGVQFQTGSDGSGSVKSGKVNTSSSGEFKFTVTIVSKAGFSWDGDPASASAPWNQASSQKTILESSLLVGNYPNPFNPTTEIRFQLPAASRVLVRIFNTLGQEIRTLTEREYEAGFHSVRWDGKDNKGNPVSSGIYLYQLKAGVFSQIKKMSLIR